MGREDTVFRQDDRNPDCAVNGAGVGCFGLAPSDAEMQIMEPDVEAGD